MFGKAKKAKASYGIVGLGRFGMALAIELAEAGEDLVVLDQDEEKVRALRDYTEAAYVVKALDKKTLEETGIQNCDVAVVCIGEKMDVSILTTLHLVSMGIPTVIAKAASEEQGQVLRKLGAQVVYPEHDMAIRLAHRLETTGMLDFGGPRQDDRQDGRGRQPARPVRPEHHRHRERRQGERVGRPQYRFPGGRHPLCLGRQERRQQDGRLAGQPVTP